eukprot:5977606-Amphidinium_carterae.1
MKKRIDKSESEGARRHHRLRTSAGVLQPEMLITAQFFCYCPLSVSVLTLHSLRGVLPHKRMRTSHGCVCDKK